MDSKYTDFAASLRRTRRISYMISGWFEMGALWKGDGGTAALAIGCPNDFVAVRLGFVNISAKSWTIKKVIGCASWTFNDYVNPTGNSVWVPFTFSSNGRDEDNIVATQEGPTEIVVAGATEGPRWTWTDWTPISSIAPRADNGLRVLMLRALIPSGQDVCYAVGQMRGLTGNSAINSGFEHFVGGLRFGLDRVEERSSHEPTLTWVHNQFVNGSMFPMVQFLTKRGGISIMMTGDSHQQGTSTTAQFSNFLYRAVTRHIGGVSGKTPVGMVNCAVGGLRSDAFFPRMSSLLKAVRPSCVILPGWTYNDCTGDVHADQPAMRLFFARLLMAAEECSSLGIAPIFTTPMPRDRQSMGPDQLHAWLWLRQSILDLQKNSGELVFDLSSLLGNRVDGQFDGTYLPHFSDDEIHPNDLGHQEIAKIFGILLDIEDRNQKPMA